MLSSASGLADPAPSGKYIFADGEQETGHTYDGKSLPSCGSSALALMRTHLPMTLVYASKPDIVRVNNEAWKSVKLAGNSFAEKVPEVGDYFLSVRFAGRGPRALGAFLYMRLDGDKKPTCADQLRLSGTYQR